MRRFRWKSRLIWNRLARGFFWHGRRGGMIVGSGIRRSETVSLLLDIASLPGAPLFVLGSARIDAPPDISHRFYIDTPADLARIS